MAIFSMVHIFQPSTFFNFQVFFIKKLYNYKVYIKDLIKLKNYKFIKKQQEQQTFVVPLV